MLKNVRIKSNNAEFINADLRFTENGTKLPLLVFIHGFKGFKDWGGFPYILEKISSSGAFTVGFNFTYNGLDNNKTNPVDFERLDLFAQNTFSRELDELGDVISWLEENEKYYDYDFSTLTLAGHSRGGGIAILKTSEDRRVKNLITLAAVAEFDRYTDERKKTWMRDGYLEVLNTRTKQRMRMNSTLLIDLEQNKQHLNIQKALKKINVPFLIVHGTEDLAVDYTEAETLYSACNKDITAKVILENTGHTFGAVHPFAGSTPAMEKVIDLIKDVIFHRLTSEK